MARFTYHLVDVFAKEALSGNGLAVFPVAEQLPTDLLQRITREMRQFESIFLGGTTAPGTYRARIFTMEEELAFAGHPIIGAAAVLHAAHFGSEDDVQLLFQLAERTVAVVSRRNGAAYQAEMDQGPATFEPPLGAAARGELLAALNLSPEDLMAELPLQVVSTGLPYLIVPLGANLASARIVRHDFAALLARVGARFAYLLDVPAREGRTWDNDGRVEDIATGSAAGPAGAYLVAHHQAPSDRPLTIHQGRFLGRPSELTVVVAADMTVRVSGDVVFVGHGELDLPDSFRQLPAGNGA